MGECAKAVLYTEGRSASEIFGNPDNLVFADLDTGTARTIKRVFCFRFYRSILSKEKVRLSVTARRPKDQVIAPRGNNLILTIECLSDIVYHIFAGNLVSIAKASQVTSRPVTTSLWN